jgi:hypothetical protein
MGSERHDSENKIYVGGLSADTTTDSLQRHFSKFGDVADCIVMMDKAAGRSRGFGFVTFKDSAAASAAIGSSNVVDGRDVSTKKAVREGSAPPPSNLVQEQGKTFNVVKIFVGGLPATCDEEKLREFFGKFGRITDAVVMMDNQTQRHRGFGYCSFESSEAVEAAVAQYSDNRIDGKWIEVKRCIPQDKIRDSDRGKASDRGRDARDGMDSRSSSTTAYPDYRQAWADYYARGGDPYAAYAAYGMGYPQHPAYAAAYGYPQGAYGSQPSMGNMQQQMPMGNMPQMGAYPMPGYPAGGAAAYSAYYGGAVPPASAAPPAAGADRHSAGRSPSLSLSRSRSRSRSRHRDRRR